MKDQKIKIIIVDDLQMIRKGYISLLQKYGIETIGEAENGNEALEILKIKIPNVLLLDLEMPILNGSKTLNIVREKYPMLKIIIVSQYHNKEVIKDMFNRGANAFISKNNNIETLVMGIRAVNSIGIYKDNLNELFKKESPKDGHWYRLVYTQREREIIALLLECKTLAEIANALCVSEKTIQAHKTAIYKKQKLKIILNL